MLKLWDRRNRFISQESGMFAGKDFVRLLFRAEALFRVFNPVSGEEFTAGRDFEYLPETASLRRIPGGRIPFLPPEALRPGEDIPCHPHPEARAVTGAVDGGRLLFDNRNFFAEHQISVDYRAEAIDLDPALPAQAEKLPAFRKKLSVPWSKLRITLLGDSISEGFNATAFTRGEPFAPSYIDRTVRFLADRFQVEITRFNRAVEGTGCAFALKHPQLWKDDSPDLLIIAYGMNEFTNSTPEKFVDSEARLIDMARKHAPDCEVVLVTPMTGNPLWKPTVPGPDAAFAAAMREFAASAGDGVALADVQKVWKMLLERKDFYDLSGNGVNHPNDYGHRVYASVLAQLLSGVPLF